MEKAEFAEYFNVLDKASDRLRTVIYVLITVYVAMLIYALSAFAYPVSQFVFDDLRRQAGCLDLPGDDAACAPIRAQMEAPPGLSGPMKHELLQHQMQAIYDDSVRGRIFTFPVFGLATDRDLLWVFFPIIGITGYYIVLLALGSLVSMFEFLRKSNENSAFRLRMIQSTLVITTPLEATDMEGAPDHRHGGMGRPLKFLWRVFALAVFAIPIIVSLLMLADQTNAIAVYVRAVPGQRFLQNATPGLGWELAVECVLLAIETVLFGSLIQLGAKFGRCQTTVEALIKRAESVRVRELIDA